MQSFDASQDGSKTEATAMDAENEWEIEDSARVEVEVAKLLANHPDSMRIDSDLSTWGKIISIRCIECYPCKNFTNTKQGRNAIGMHMITAHSLYGDAQWVFVNDDSKVVVVTTDRYDYRTKRRDA